MCFDPTSACGIARLEPKYGHTFARRPAIARSSISFGEACCFSAIIRKPCLQTAYFHILRFDLESRAFSPLHQQGEGIYSAFLPFLGKSVIELGLVKITRTHLLEALDTLHPSPEYAPGERH